MTSKETLIVCSQHILFIFQNIIKIFQEIMAENFLVLLKLLDLYTKVTVFFKICSFYTILKIKLYYRL